MTPMQWTAREGAKIHIPQHTAGARLDTGTRLAILRRLAEGQTQSRIALEVGVNVSTICRVAKRLAKDSV